MARQSRIKAKDQPAWYHIYSRAADYAGRYPLNRRARRRLLQVFRHYLQAYFCEAASWEALGNHYHAVIRFEEPREVEREELRRRARLLYPDKNLDSWGEPAWERLRQRLFDVSELMRNVQGDFAAWFNGAFNRRGHFWGARFGSTLLADGEALLDCMLYVELNAVRAGLADTPEQWADSSCRMRCTGRGDWLMPLGEVFPWMEPETVEKDYRALLYYRGAIVTEEGERVIPPHIVQAEIRRGFRTSGSYRKRLGCFTQGLILGGREAVEGWIEQLSGEGRWTRRRRPAGQPEGSCFALRPQRIRGSPG